MVRIPSEGEDSIHYNVGFKSYEISRCRNEVDRWFEWIERSRNLMRRVSVSIKVLRWLVTAFIDASKEQGKTVKRWRMKDHFSDYFCTLKYNESGRYISFIAIQGQNKSVIITPESTYKGVWGNIADKIAKFIYEPKERQVTQTKAETTKHLIQGSL